MKKWLVWVLPLFIFVLSACSAVPWGSDTYLRPVTFYYGASEEISYSSETGALYKEVRDLGSKSYDLETVAASYLNGPLDQSAYSPFPEQLQLLDAALEQGVLTLYVTDHWLEMTMLEEHLAEACLVMTMTQFDEVEQLCIRTELEEISQIPYRYLKPEDFLLFDDSATSDHVAVKLYFSDHNARYLVEESRSRAPAAAEAMAEYIVKELLNGSHSDRSLPVLPEGVNLLGVELSQGICTVDFSEAFLTNCPKTHAQARMTVFSVVNSLTELPEVESVRFTCVGKEIGDYAGIDLSQVMFREEAAIRDSQPSAAVFEGTLYVPCGSEKLAAIPMFIRQSAGKMGADALLNTLLFFKSANGYVNPFPDGTALLDQTTRDGLCTVTFNHAFAVRNSDPQQLRLAIRSVVATLCSLEQIDRVVVKVSDEKLTDSDLGRELTPQNTWFLP